MLTQQDVVKLLSKEPPPPQVACFSILHAYVYSKSARGNLPSETLSKILSIQRKLQFTSGGRYLDNPSIKPAFEAIKTAMMAVNRQWFAKGPLAFGPLGQVGATGGDSAAQLAWTKATDGKVKVFPDGNGAGAWGWGAGEMDAGRVIEPIFQDSADPLGTGNAPPMYEPPPGGEEQQPDQAVVDALNDRRVQDEAGTAHESAAWRHSVDEGSRDGVPPSLRRGSIEEGAAHLARMRLLKEEKERRESASPSPMPSSIKEEPADTRRD
ncbi:hypothetical protein JCM8547_002261 [Rhodosporidiobolus lusitaniae]